MLDLFLYNWQVREDWFKWCETISKEELSKQRIGGMGSILHNLFHVADCEQIWVNQMQGTPIIKTNADSITSLKDVIIFSNETKLITRNFLQTLTDDFQDKVVTIENKHGKTFTFTYGKILRHIVTHEIHHIGQLSVWARELNQKPISSDLIMRQYM